MTYINLYIICYHHKSLVAHTINRYDDVNIFEQIYSITKKGWLMIRFNRRLDSFSMKSKIYNIHVGSH